jgi:Lrp/AsnC family leucine-responsive transcriptional regulator
MTDANGVRLDAIDRRILAELRSNARITYQRLSGLVGLSPRPCLERVRRLEARGVIRGYTALLDPAVTGHRIVTIAAIQMREQISGARDRLEKRLEASASVVEVIVPSGDFDYLARVVTPDLETYETLTAAWLGDPSLGIARINTTFVLKTVRAFSGYPVAEA